MKEEEMSESPLELVSTVTEFNDLHDFMDDEQLDRALHLVVKLYMEKGRMNPAQAAALIVELQALATKFAVLGTYYMTIGKKGSADLSTQEINHRKNVYMTLKDSITKLVDSLKYVSKA
jgi:hypothetical protein